MREEFDDFYTSSSVVVAAHSFFFSLSSSIVRCSPANLEIRYFFDLIDFELNLFVVVF